MTALQQLAKLLGLSEQNAGDSLTSERAARAVLSRRDLFAAGAAMASAAVFSFDSRRFVGWVTRNGAPHSAAYASANLLFAESDALVRVEDSAWFDFAPGVNHRGERVIVQCMTALGKLFVGVVNESMLPRPRKTRLSADVSPSLVGELWVS